MKKDEKLKVKLQLNRLPKRMNNIFNYSLKKSKTFMSTSMAEKQGKKITGVVQEYSNKLFRFIRDKVATNVEAEDILQEV